MAETKGKEKGTRQTRQFRSGIDLPYFRGLNRDMDAGAIGDSELQDAINIRLVSGRIENRGGQEKLNEEALDGCVWSIDDLPMPTVGLFVAHADDAEFTLDRYNLDFTPNYQGVYPAASTPNLDEHQPFGNSGEPRRVLFVWRDKLLAANTTNGQVFEVVLPKEGVDGDISFRQLIGDQPDGDQIEISDMASVPEGGEEILYIGSTSTNKVWRYDGVQLSSEGAVGSGGERMVLGRFHDQLYVSGRQYLLRRTVGLSGTYTSLTMPGGVTTFRPSAMCEFGDELVIAGLDASISPSLGVPGPGCLLVYDGSTVTLARQPDDGAGPGVFRPARGVSDVFLWNGKVWYLWREFGTDPNTWIGNYDGSTWNDTVASLGTSQSGSANSGDLVTANGLLYATTIGGASSTNDSALWSSDDGSTWTQTYNITANQGGGVVTCPGNLAVYG